MAKTANKAPAKVGARTTVGRMRPKPEDKDPNAITDAERRFVLEYMVDLNGTQAYIRANPGVSTRTANTLACRLLSKVKIQDAVTAARLEQEKRTEVKADQVILENWAIATADPRELMELKVGCCRFCWGDDHRYQRTEAEFAEYMAAHAKASEDAVSAGKPVVPFDPQGGKGYNRSRKPNGECPECGGDGVSRVVLHDTSTISRAAASLFAGVKQSDKGVVEVKVHSKDAALDKLMRHLGIYNDKLELTMPTVVIKDLTGRKA